MWRIVPAVLIFACTYWVWRRRFASKRIMIWTRWIQKVVFGTKTRIVIVDSLPKWWSIEKELIESGSEMGAVGFDCEWVSEGKYRHPVALVQLATYTGLCVLIRMSMIPELPEELKDFLADPDVFKVGVGPVNDCKMLEGDYNIVVEGAIDLMDFFCYDGNKYPSDYPLKPLVVGINAPTKLGLASLANTYLNRVLEKDWRVRASDWEDEYLDDRQIAYAAEDARSGLHVLLQLLVETEAHKLLEKEQSADMIETTRSILRKTAKFIVSSRPPDGWSKGKSKQSSVNNTRDKSYNQAYSIRKGPLYHNSILWAPDDVPLCIVDPKKAQWYVDNKLGEVVQEDPLIVRLNFEPSGRPVNEGNDGNFYLQERINECVCCGRKDSYIRKNVVPREYRRHFPEVLKSHQNHDVVLLCAKCHKNSNIADNVFRYQLAEAHDAPIGNDVDVKVRVDINLKAVKSAGRALTVTKNKIPEWRREELKDVIKKYYEVDEVSPELLKSCSEMSGTVFNESYESHGLRVYRHFERTGVIELEKLWRQNFIETMKPKFLPDCWSVTHNHAKLRIKMARYEPGTSDWEQYKISLVGTEGTSDVVYKPVPQRERTSRSKEKDSVAISAS